jgi:cytochrome c-type biogenesis protein CcmH
MIRGMVDGLAARLQQNPDDAAGWQRLANAYRVLGEDEKAAEAAAHLAALRPNDVGVLLDQAHAMLGPGQGRDPKVPLPEDFLGVMKRVEAIDPKQPEALWYLGLAEAQRRNMPAAKDYWQRLLAVLDPTSREYKTVQDALGAIGAKN